jgi:hypothetical protein
MCTLGHLNPPLNVSPVQAALVVAKYGGQPDMEQKMEVAIRVVGGGLSFISMIGTRRLRD